MLSHIFKKILFKIKSFCVVKSNRKVELGVGVRIDLNTKVRSGVNKLTIGDNVYLRSLSNGYHGGMPFSTTILIDKPGAECEIGDNCRINGAYIHAQKKIIIGRNTVIASGVNILDSNGHVLASSNRTINRDQPKDIIIGENVWIGLNCIILKGSVIGNNCVIAAGSIVKGVFPDNVLIQGNPAKNIKTLVIS